VRMRAGTDGRRRHSSRDGARLSTRWHRPGRLQTVARQQLARSTKPSTPAAASIGLQCESPTHWPRRGGGRLATSTQCGPGHGARREACARGQGHGLLTRPAAHTRTTHPHKAKPGAAAPAPRAVEAGVPRHIPSLHLERPTALPSKDTLTIAHHTMPCCTPQFTPAGGCKPLASVNSGDEGNTRTNRSHWSVDHEHRHGRGSGRGGGAKKSVGKRGRRPERGKGGWRGGGENKKEVKEK